MSKVGAVGKNIPSNLLLPSKGRNPLLREGKHKGGRPRNEDRKPEDDSAKFRDDLFWVYKQWGGKKKLLDLVRSEEKSDMQKHFIKSLISVYGKELDIKLKQMAAQPLGSGGKNFIFIMDGLDKKNGQAEGLIPASLPMQLLNQILNTEGIPDLPDGNVEEETLIGQDDEPA